MVCDSALAWALTLFLAWWLGEWLCGFKMPRILTYSLVGLVAGQGLHWIHGTSAHWGREVADIAVGLALFEIGFRFNPKWLLSNRWVLALGLTESIVTYVAVFLCGLAANLNSVHASVGASLCVATSPISVLRVTRELQSTGQVTNLVLTLSAINAMIALLLFKVSVGVGISMVAEGPPAVPGTILLVVLSSIHLAILAAFVFRGIRWTTKMPHDSVAFTIAIYVALVTILSDALRLSPALSSLVLGISFRAMNIKVTGKYQDFGSFGRFCTLVLFVFVASGIQFAPAIAGMAVGVAMMAARAVVKIGACLIFASPLGIRIQQGGLVGIALMPVSVFGLMLLEQSSQYGVDWLEQLPWFTALALCLEVLGPIATRIAIEWSGEGEPSLVNGRGA